MEVSRTNSYDTYTCSVLEQPFWECLDIASARTLSGSYKNSEIYNVSSNLDVLQQAEMIRRLFWVRPPLGSPGDQTKVSSTSPEDRSL